MVTSKIIYIAVVELMLRVGRWQWKWNSYLQYLVHVLFKPYILILFLLKKIWYLNILTVDLKYNII